MAKRTPKTRLTKADRELEEAKAKLEQIELERKEAENDFNRYCMEKLAKNLGTDDLDEVEQFIDSVKPVDAVNTAAGEPKTALGEKSGQASDWG